MILHLNFGENFGDFPFAVDDKRGAFNAHVFPSVHRFFLPNAIRFGHRVIRIGQQGKGQAEFFPKLRCRIITRKSLRHWPKFPDAQTRPRRIPRTGIDNTWTQRHRKRDRRRRACFSCVSDADKMPCVTASVACLSCPDITPAYPVPDHKYSELQACGGHQRVPLAHRA